MTNEVNFSLVIVDVRPEVCRRSSGQDDLGIRD